MGEGSAIPTDPYHTPTITQPSTSQPQKTQKPRKPKRKDTQVPQPSGPTDIIADEAVHKELGDRLVRAATTASSLEAKQDSGNITKTQSKATPNEAGSQGTTSSGGPRCQETIGDTIAETRFENKTKTTQQNEIASLKRGVKKLENKRSSRSHKLKRLYKVGLSARVESSVDEEDLDDVDNEIFDVDALTGDEVFAEQEVAAKDVNLTIDEVTLAQALVALKSVKPKVKGDVIKEPSVPVSAVSAPTKVSATTKTATIPTLRKGIVITELGTPTTTISSQQSQDKGKGIMIEELVKPMKKKVQIMLDEEDKIEADHELAQRLQAEEQEELSVKEKAKLFQQLLE
ncbi:hypothetical protein Tco_0323004 [Tanacetum coccineum]